MMSTTDNGGRGSLPFRRRWALLAALALPLAACDVDGLLEIEDPDVATPGSLRDVAALPVLHAGAVADFQLAFGGNSGASNGNTEGLVNMSAIFSDEYEYVSSFPTRIEIDQRSVQVNNSSLVGIFRNLQRARVSAERAAEAYSRLRPNVAEQAEALSLAGFLYVLMAEHYCSGLPFSTLTETGATEYGAPLTTVQTYERALQRFDEALTVATAANSAAQQNLARVGRGRALLNLNRPAEAAAAVAAVPTSFVYNVQHSENSGRQQNGLFVLQQLGRRVSVANRQGGTGLAYRADADPRVPQARGTGTLATSDRGFDLFVQNKYTTRTTAIVLASGAEARLIEAEAALRGGGNWLAILNSLRASPPAYFPASAFPGIGGLQPLTDPGTEAARVDLLFRERAYWTWLTAHRVGDMRRLVRQYGRSQASVFPSGEFFRGGTYGSDVNFPIPMDEQNNPQFEQCIDRTA